jgi:hypothetical protein
MNPNFWMFAMQRKRSVAAYPGFESVTPDQSLPPLFHCGHSSGAFDRERSFNCGSQLFLFGRRLCSECCRWVLPGVRTLTATKRLLGTATGAGPNGGCMRYCGHRASETRLPPRHRPLPHHLDWWYRPRADRRTVTKLPFDGEQQAVSLLRTTACSSFEPGANRPRPPDAGGATRDG